jgi:hypothetical protein
MDNNCFVEYKNNKLEFIFKSVQANVFEINPSITQCM